MHPVVHLPRAADGIIGKTVGGQAPRHPVRSRPPWPSQSMLDHRSGLVRSCVGQHQHSMYIIRTDRYEN